MEIFLVVVGLLCALNAEAQVTANISPDEDYNAPLDENSVIRFNCTGTGSIIVWLIDGTEVTAGSTLSSRGVSTTPVEMIGGTIFSSLSIQGSKENDNTSIQCRTIRTVPTVSLNSSNLIFLNIQGPLGPPQNLILSEANENCTRILSWDAPETLNLTDIEPDILYYTVCHNLTGDMNCTNISSTRERMVEFVFCNVSVTLLFSVTAVNVIGEGNTSSIFYWPLGNRFTMPIDTTTVTAALPDLPTSEGASNQPSGIESTVGGIIGVIIVVAALLIVAVIVLCWQHKKKKSKNLKQQSTVHLLESVETDGSKGSTNTLTQNGEAEKDAGGFYETIVTEKKVPPTDSIIESTSLENHRDHEPDTTKQRDSPTSPLYTEIMGKDKSKPEVNGTPQALPDDVKGSDSNVIGLPIDEEPPKVPDQNFTKEDLELLNLSMNGPETELPQQVPASKLESSQQSLQSSLKAPATAAAGDPLYAELEHEKKKKKIVAPDNTGVQYSEIKIDEIPPRLPQKKSRRSKDQSSPVIAEKQAHTPTTPVNTPILETEIENLDSYKL